jgi:uncharacterized protein
VKSPYSFLIVSAVIAGGVPASTSLLAEEADSAPQLVSRTAGGVRWKNNAELKAAADAGDPQAWSQLGEQLLRGDRMPKNGAEGVALLEKAARAGVASAAFRIGMLLDDGEEVARDRPRALAYFRAAAAGDVAEAYHNVGAAYAGAHGVKRDYVEALGWLILAKKSGVGLDSEQTVRARILKLKHPEWIPAAEKRAAEIERELAASPWANFLPASAPLVYFDASNARDRENPLAVTTVREKSPPQRDSAIKLVLPTGRQLSWASVGELEQAADRGDATALAALGQVLLEGKLVEEDIARARSLLERAAKSGNIDAAQQLADLYTTGRKMPPDAAKAFQYNLQAARGGSRQAMFNTGALLTNGLGTERDMTEALAWLAVAKHHGVDPGAEQRLRDYLSKNQPSQLAIAERRAAELRREIEANQTKAP